MAEETDRLYKIFIGSTFTGLEHERKAAIEAVLRSGHIPLALERFVPTNKSDVEVIGQAIETSQVCIFILGHRYGEIMPGTDISFSEYEYNLAKKHGHLTLSFLLDDPTVFERRKAMAASEDPREKADAENDQRLKRFRERVRAQGGSTFKPTDEEKFTLIVEVTLAKTLKDPEILAKHKIKGFIREPDDLKVLTSATNQFIGDIVTALRGFEKLYGRTQDETIKKRGAAKFFVSTYFDRLYGKSVSLFFESGSTVAFVAKEMSLALRGKVKLDREGDAGPTIQISTNNVLAYLLLWLCEKIPCTNFPWSPPVEPKFGAAYGGLEEIFERPPDYRQPALDATARHEIKRLHNMPYSLGKMRAPKLLLGAVSGLQLTNRHTLRFPEDEPDFDGRRMSAAERAQKTDEISRCFGPHVGSYHNKIFKRFMYDSQVPILIFLTSNKIDCPIDVTKCHFIFDRQDTWEDFFTNHPVAFCVGCGGEHERVRLVQLFEARGFSIESEDGLETSSFIARSAKFDEMFESQLSDEEPV